MDITLGFLYSRGHVGADSSDRKKMASFVPQIRERRNLIVVILVTIQALACVPRAKEIFSYWAAREGRASVGMDGLDAGFCPLLQPWFPNESWTFATWALAVQVVTRFLDQEMVSSDERFAETLLDLYIAARDDCWAIDVMIQTLYFVKAAKWFWKILFKDTAP